MPVEFALLRCAVVAVCLTLPGWASAAGNESPSATTPLWLLANLQIADEQGKPVHLLSPEALHAEFGYLRAALHQINLADAPVKTDGWTYNIPEAEWPFMSCCYFGFACADLAATQPAKRDEYLAEMRWLIDALQKPRLSGFITDHFGLPFGPGKITPSSFVQGLFLNLALRYREVSQDPRYDELIHRVASALNDAFAQSNQGIIRSYKTMWWLSDNCPALSALHRHDTLFHTDYSRQCARFVASIKGRYLDKQTGLFATYINADTQQVLQGPRGISVMYGLHFLRDIDPLFARQQYTSAQRAFIRTGGGVAAVREHPEGVDGIADVDSGPLMLGFGPSASGFAIAAAAVMGDRETAEELIRASALAGAPEFHGGKLRYNSMPTVGQAVILFGKTTLLRSEPK